MRESSRILQVCCRWSGEMEPQPYTRNVICMSSSIVFQWDSTYTCKNRCLQGPALTEHKSSDWGVPCSEPSTASVMQMHFAGWPISSDRFCTSGAPVAAFLRLASPRRKRTPLLNQKAALLSLLQPGSCEESARSAVRAVMFPRCSWSAVESQASCLARAALTSVAKGGQGPVAGGCSPARPELDLPALQPVTAARISGEPLVVSSRGKALGGQRQGFLG